jgi:hypothetical protein
MQRFGWGGRRAFGVGTAMALVAATAMLAPASGSAEPAGPPASAAGNAGRVTYSVGVIHDVSAPCAPGTGDVDDAVDPAHHDVYVEFEGCDNNNAVGFVRSTNGGVSFGPAAALPGSKGGWDPWLAVAPDGTLYAAFMNTIGGYSYPIIDVSHDYGRSFQVEQSLKPAKKGNWGDADYIAVAPNGTLYVSYSYGPSNAEVKSRCSPKGSCWATNGDLNVAVQSSTNEGKSWTPISIVNPGYPNGGADEGDLLVAPDGAIDVLYQDYQVVNQTTLRLAHGHEFFTTSTDGGRTWSVPVEVGATVGQITINEWWNDGYISSDSVGDLYATWDTQGWAKGRKTDTGWLSFSTDGGSQWSAPIQVSPDDKNVPHITESAGFAPGQAYVAWLSSVDPPGYELYLRTFSVQANGGHGGWLSQIAQISRRAGNPLGNPGDTFGIETDSSNDLALSWGSALYGAHRKASVYETRVRVLRAN